MPQVAILMNLQWRYRNSKTSAVKAPLFVKLHALRADVWRLYSGEETLAVNVAISFSFQGAEGQLR